MVGAREMTRTPEAPPPPPIPGAPDESEKPLTNGMAVASLACGIFGWVFVVGGLLGIVLGIVALGQIRESRKNGVPQGGAGLATAGIVIGAIMGTISVLTLVLIYG